MAASDADDLDFVGRELCADGNCIGVIGPNGRCKECGAVSPNVNVHSRNRNLKPLDDDEPVMTLGADEDRRLCPDGGCIGIIGDDGRCKECGLPADSAADSAADSTGDTGDARQLVAVIDDGDADEFDDRQLCPDGSCIGLIGPDGRCKECGLSASASVDS